MFFAFLFIGVIAVGEIYDRRWLKGKEMAKQREGLGAEKPEETGDVDLRQVFPESGRDLNRLFTDPSLKRFLKEVEENKREVRAFLTVLEGERNG